MSVECFWNELQSFGAGGGVEAAVPCGEEEIVLGEHKGASQVQCIQTAQFALDR